MNLVQVEVNKLNFTFLEMLDKVLQPHALGKCNICHWTQHQTRSKSLLKYHRSPDIPEGLFNIEMDQNIYQVLECVFFPTWFKYSNANQQGSPVS